MNKLEKVFENDVFREVANNSAESASALNTMNKHMETLLSNFGATANMAPSAPTIPTTPTVKAQTKKPVEQEILKLNLTMWRHKQQNLLNKLRLNLFLLMLP